MFGRSSFGPRFGGRRERKQPEPVPNLCAETLQLATAIESATIMEREPDEDGPRVIVHAPALGSGFIYNRGDAEKRIRRYFPTLTAQEVKAAVLHIEGRVRLAITPRPTERKPGGWVHGWKEER